jgi:hypothetical protein
MYYSGVITGIEILKELRSGGLLDGAHFMNQPTTVDNVLTNNVMALLCMLCYVAQLLLPLDQQHVHHLLRNTIILIVVDDNFY